MSDATLSQVNRLLELIMREQDPRGFLQRLIENWGVVQTIGRGEFTQAAVQRVLTYLSSLPGEKSSIIRLLDEGTFLERLIAERREGRNLVSKTAVFDPYFRKSDLRF